MKYFIFILIFLFSCSLNRKKTFDYPQFIQENHLETYYNEAKWVLYVSYYSCFSNDRLSELFAADFELISYDTLDYWFVENQPTNSPSTGNPEKCIFYTFNVPFEFSYGEIGCNIYRLGFISDTISIVEEKYDYGVFNFDRRVFRNNESLFMKDLQRNKTHLTPWLYMMSKEKGMFE